MSLLEGLLEIGFTEYEAKVYLALLRDNPATGYQISKKSGVPRSMVYEALGRLHTRGAVLETVEGRATLYRPLPPLMLLDRHEEEHQALMEGLRQGLQKMYDAPEEDRVWSILGRKSALAYSAQMIREAQNEIFLVLNDEDLDALRAEIMSAFERGVRIHALLTGIDELACGRVAHHPPLESQLQELTNTLMVVADDAETLIASTNNETTATITNNANLVLIARQFVWMELFAQRIYARLGPELLSKLDEEDRQIFESLG